MELGGFRHFPFLNDALEWKSRFTLGRDVSKSTDYIEKYFNQMSSKIKFPTKTLLGGRICQSLPVVELGPPRICHFLNIMHWYGNGKSLELPSSPTKEDRHDALIEVFGGNIILDNF